MKHKEVILIGIKNKEISHYNMSNLISVVDKNCFRHSNIKSIVPSRNLKRILDLAFDTCPELVRVDFRNTKLESIEHYAFSRNESLREVNLPSTLINLGAGIFDRCSNLEVINIPNKVLKLREYTFFGCKSLLKLDINNVSDVDYRCFVCADIEVKSKLGFKVCS